MAKNWKEALEELGGKAREFLAGLGLVQAPPELVPVPVRNNPRPGRPGEPSRR